MATPVPIGQVQRPSIKAQAIARMITAATMPSIMAAAKPGSRPLRLIMNGLANIAKPATTAAPWVRVVAITLTGSSGQSCS